MAPHNTHVQVKAREAEVVRVAVEDATAASAQQLRDREAQVLKLQGQLVGLQEEVEELQDQLAEVKSSMVRSLGMVLPSGPSSSSPSKSASRSPSPLPPTTTTAPSSGNGVVAASVGAAGRAGAPPAARAASPSPAPSPQRVQQTAPGSSEAGRGIGGLFGWLRGSSAGSAKASGSSPAAEQLKEAVEGVRSRSQAPEQLGPAAAQPGAGAGAPPPAAAPLKPAAAPAASVPKTEAPGVVSTGAGAAARKPQPKPPSPSVEDTLRKTVSGDADEVTVRLGTPSALRRAGSPAGSLSGAAGPEDGGAGANGRVLTGPVSNLPRRSSKDPGTPEPSAKAIFAWLQIVSSQPPQLPPLPPPVGDEATAGSDGKGRQ